MNGALDFLVRHGATVLFVVVFIEQMGLPLPATPWLLAAGALAAAGKMNWAAAFVAAVIGSLLADIIWFYLGRKLGNRVLSLLCRISLEPDSCVRKTQNMFTRRGMKAVIITKFIPGLSLLVPPLAGNSGVSASRFVCFDALGSSLYVGSFILLGVVFARQLDKVIAELASLGGNALALVAGLAALYIAYKYFQRRRLLGKLRTARISVDELNQKLNAGEQPAIFDLRSSEELQHDPSVIRGARHATMDEIERGLHEIPRDRDIILYCSCPNEVTSAKMALKLHQHGITRARPLLGGIDAWHERNYPTETWVVAVTNSFVTIEATATKVL